MSFDFEYPITRRPGNFDCACVDCDNDPVMWIGEDKYCHSCGVPILAVIASDCEREAQDLSDRLKELQALADGRKMALMQQQVHCPSCGSVLAWQDDGSLECYNCIRKAKMKEDETLEVKT